MALRHRPGVRILAFDTSSTRGSVALVEGKTFEDAVVRGYARHDEPNRHAEKLLLLIDDALGEAHWKKEDIERLAVGVGPGSFTGIRVGLSLAQGLMLGLRIPGVGIGSLKAIAAGVSGDDKRLRVVVRDARREEYFVAAYDAVGREVTAPHTIPQTGASETIAQAFIEENFVVVGTELPHLPGLFTDLTTDPDARLIAKLAFEADPAECTVTPRYVRGPNVKKPLLPKSPLAGPRQF